MRHLRSGHQFAAVWVLLYGPQNLSQPANPFFAESLSQQTLQLIRQGRIETEEAYRKLLQLPAKSILVFNQKQAEVTADEEVCDNKLLRLYYNLIFFD